MGRIKLEYEAFKVRVCISEIKRLSERTPCVELLFVERDRNAAVGNFVRSHSHLAGVSLRELDNIFKLLEIDCRHVAIDNSKADLKPISTVLGTNLRLTKR